MFLASLLLAVASGWFGWSGWLAVPLGLAMFWDSRKSVREDGHRVGLIGIPIYVLASLALLKLVAFSHLGIRLLAPSV